MAFSDYLESDSGITIEVTAFLNTTITLMDTLDWVERYAWFGYFVSPFAVIPSFFCQI